MKHGQDVIVDELLSLTTNKAVLLVFTNWNNTLYSDQPQTRIEFQVVCLSVILLGHMTIAAS